MKRLHLLRRLGHMIELAVVATGAAIGGAVVEHFLDPDRGHARRARLRDEVRGILRSSTRRVAQSAFGAARHWFDHWRGMTRSKVQRTLGRTEVPDNVTVAQKVRSEVVGHLDADLRHISIDAVDGVVTLRGEVNSVGDGAKIVDSVQRVRGVRRVDNLLHQRGDDAPNKKAALRLQDGTF